MLEEYEKAKEDLDKIMVIEPHNGEARGILKKV
jgi:hypothetical protein